MDDYTGHVKTKWYSSSISQSYKAVLYSVATGLSHQPVSVQNLWLLIRRVSKRAVPILVKYVVYTLLEHIDEAIDISQPLIIPHFCETKEKWYISLLRYPANKVDMKHYDTNIKEKRGQIQR